MPRIRFASRYVLVRLLIGLAWLMPAAVLAQEPVPPAAELPPQAAERARLALAAARARHAPLALYAPTAFPEALSAGQAASVKFTVLLAGGAAVNQPAVSLFVSGLNTTVPMRDDGQGADLSAGDRIYSASVAFQAADAVAGRCYDARATALSTGGQTVLSGVRRVCVTRYTVGIAASDTGPGNVIPFTEGDITGPVLSDQALVQVRAGTSDDRIAAIAGTVGGEVVGSLPAQNLYQIRLPSRQTTTGLVQTLARLQRAGGVVQAAPNALVQLQAPPVLPLATSDPEEPTQDNLGRIKADRAWRITKGDPAHVIAIIDSGADFDQPDFWATPGGTDGRFATSGANLVAANCVGVSGCAVVTQPLACHATNTCNTGNAATDTYGHGTVVAGFASAATDNATSVAGATWNNKLLVVRTTDNGVIDAGKLLDGINHARSSGARVLSISAGAPFLFVGNQLCPAIATADLSEGRLVVAAAGNDGTTTMNYPAACTCGVGAACPDAASTGAATVMAVANSEVNGLDQDVIHTGTLPSNYGSWVKFAAPGTNVKSTARTGACATCNAAYTGSGHVTVTGTSFSTPLVAGAVALALARAPLGTSNADIRSNLYATGVALQAPAADAHRIDILAALLTYNAAPTGLTFPGACIPENTDTTVPASVGSLTTTDPDTGLTTHEYSVVGGADAAKFSIGGVNADQLMISDGVLNFETKPTYSVRVRTTDVGNAFTEQDLLVGVCDVNEPPVVASPTFSLPENSAAATVVGTLVATDPEGLPLAFSIHPASNPGGAFAISSAGAITVANSLALDFETTPSFSLEVTVTDGINNVIRFVPVDLTNVDEPPTITGGSFSIAENTVNGTTVGTISASDPEGTPNLSITAGNTGGAFAISNTGEITVANSTALNFEATPVFTLTVAASDGVNPAVTAIVTVTLTDVAEGIPNPILVFDRMETGVNFEGTPVDRYFFRVTNWQDYPVDFFAPRPDLPPCGLNNAASRAWVFFFRSDNNQGLQGFCALGTTDMLNGQIWFGVMPSGDPHPPAVYIKITDREPEPDVDYTSNSAPIP